MSMFPEGRRIIRTPDNGQERGNVVFLKFKVFCLFKNESAGYTEWKKEEETILQDIVTGKRRGRQNCCCVLLFYVPGKHLRSCRDGQLT